MCWSKISINWCKIKTRSDWLSKRGYLAWNCTCAWSDIADVTREQKLQLSWRQKCNSCYEKNTLEINEYECLPNFELKFNFLENLRTPLTLKSTRKRIDIDFERVSNVCALARLTKIENVRFCSGGFSYAIQEKFTAWRVNSTLNFTWKTDIALIASRFARYRFFAWNLSWNSL